MGSILYLKQCPPQRRRHAVRQYVRRLRGAVGPHEGLLEGLTAIHDGEHVYRGLYANAGVADKPTYPRAEHPVVRTHPVTGRQGRSTSTGASPRGIVGMPRDESDAHPALPLRSHREPAVPVPLPLARELDRVLGQSLRPASRDVGLLAAHPLGQPGHDQGGPTLLTSWSTVPIRIELVATGPERGIGRGFG